MVSLSGLCHPLDRLPERTGSLDPPALFDWLAGCPIRQGLCVECGAGTGEISAYLSGTFGSVIPIDKNPPSRSLLPVLRASAEQIPCRENSVDLLVSMQSLHHFDIEEHIKEASRVLRPGGVFAALCWGEIQLPATIAQAYKNIFEMIAPFWEARRSWVVSGYRGLQFPGRRMELPEAEMSRGMSLEQLDVEVSRWSAVQSAFRNGLDIPDPIEDLLSETEHAFRVSWPIYGQVFRC